MSIGIALARGALDIAVGFVGAGITLVRNIATRIGQKLGIWLTLPDTEQIMGIAESSIQAIDKVWTGVPIDTENIPVASVPFYGNIDGGQSGQFIYKIATHSTDGDRQTKQSVWFESDEIMDKIGIEQYIREFWEGVRQTGIESPEVMVVDIGNLKNVPVYLVRRF